MELPIISVLNTEQMSDVEQIYNKAKCAYNGVYFEFFSTASDLFETNCTDFDSLIDKPAEFVLNSMSKISDALLQVLFDYDIYSVDVNTIIEHLLNEKTSLGVMCDLSEAINEAVNIVEKVEGLNRPSDSNRVNVQWDFASWFEEGYNNDGINGAKSNITSNMIKSVGLSAINAAVKSNANTKFQKIVKEAKKAAFDAYYDRIKEATLHAIADMSKYILLFVLLHIGVKYDCDKELTSIMKRFDDTKFKAGLFYNEDAVNTTIFRNVNDMYSQGKMPAQKAAEQICKIIIDNPYANPRYYTKLMQLCPDNADAILSTAENYGMNAFACCNSMFLLMLEPTPTDSLEVFDVNIKLLRKALPLITDSGYTEIMYSLISENSSAKEYCTFCSVNTLKETTTYYDELKDMKGYLSKTKERIKEYKAQNKLSVFIQENFSDVDFNDYSECNYNNIKQKKEKLEKYNDVTSSEKNKLFKEISKFEAEYKRKQLEEFIEKNLADVDFSVFSEKNYEKLFYAYEELNSDFSGIHSEVRNELLSKINRFFTEYDKNQLEEYLGQTLNKINFNDYSYSNYQNVKAENDILLNKYKNVESEKKNEALNLFENYYKKFEKNRLVNLKLQYDAFVKKNLSDEAFADRSELQKKIVSDNLEMIKNEYAEVADEELIKRCEVYIKEAKPASAHISNAIGYVILFLVLYLITGGIGSLLSKIPYLGVVINAISIGFKIVWVICGVILVLMEFDNIKKHY